MHDREGSEAHSASEHRAIVLDVRCGEELLDEVTVTVVQTGIYVDREYAGEMDCLAFQAARPMDSETLRRRCAGRLWDLHEVVSQALCQRGPIADCFAEGSFAVLEHVQIRPEYQRQRIGERALRSLLMEHLPPVRWLYANVDAAPAGRMIEQWLGALFPVAGALGSYSYLRYGPLTERAKRGA